MVLFLYRGASCGVGRIATAGSELRPMRFSRRRLIGYPSIFASLGVVGLVAAGCSVHPLPEDVSRASTYDIVQRIRCEVKEALDTFKDDPRAARIIKVTTIGYDFNFNISEGNHISDGAKPGAALTLRNPSFKDASKGFTLDVTARAEKMARTPAGSASSKNCPR